MHLRPISLAIRILHGRGVPPRCPTTKETAVNWLRNVSGEDFGDDPGRWSEWLKHNRWAYSK